MVKELEFIYLLNEEGKEEKMNVITFFKIEDTNQEICCCYSSRFRCRGSLCT